MSDHLDSCIWIDPGRQSGQPCFGGTRVPVATVMTLPDEAIADWYPSVTPEHIKAMRWWLAQPLVEDMLRGSL